VSHDRYESAVAEPFKGPGQADYKSAQDYRTGANVAFVAGGVVAAAGTVWGLIDLLGTKRRPTPRVGVVTAPRFVGLAGWF
jgi:hypothetical protein